MVMMPMLFWASFAPCENESTAELSHWNCRRYLLRIGRAPCTRNPITRCIQNPTQKPIMGEMIRDNKTLVTPVR